MSRDIFLVCSASAPPSLRLKGSALKNHLEKILSYACDKNFAQSHVVHMILGFINLAQGHEDHVIVSENVWCFKLMFYK